MIHLLHEIGIGPEGDGIVMVRCGRLGGCVGTKKGGLKWFPAFHGGEREHLVKDVTGGELDARRYFPQCAVGWCQGMIVDRVV